MNYISINKGYYLTPMGLIFLNAYLQIEEDGMSHFADVQKKSGLTRHVALGVFSSLTKKLVIERTDKNISGNTFIVRGHNFDIYVKSSK